MFARTCRSKCVARWLLVRRASSPVKARGQREANSPIPASTSPAAMSHDFEEGEDRSSHRARPWRRSAPRRFGGPRRSKSFSFAVHEGISGISHATSARSLKASCEGVPSGGIRVPRVFASLAVAAALNCWESLTNSFAIARFTRRPMLRVENRSHAMGLLPGNS